jgi:hypothetical protein
LLVSVHDLDADLGVRLDRQVGQMGWMDGFDAGLVFGLDCSWDWAGRMG